MKKYIAEFLSILMLVGGIMFFGGCGKKEDVVVFPDNVNELIGAENSELAESSNVRIMSANVLVHIKGWGGTPVLPRAQVFSQMLNHYLPDVVALQEFCRDWYRLLPPLIEENYQLVDTKKSDYTTMIYNKNTLNMIDSGVLRYSKESNKNCRFVVWAVFEKKDTGERFSVTSTHWDFGMEDKKVEMRNTQIAELNDLVKKLNSQYNAPVFACGDFNCFENDKNNGADSYQKFVEVSGTKDAKFIDGITLNIGKATTFEEESWDHIFVTNNTEIKSFTILAEDYSKEFSDHYPIFVDAKI